MPSNLQPADKIALEWMRRNDHPKIRENIGNMLSLADGDPIVLYDLILEAGEADEKAMPDDKTLDVMQQIITKDAETTEGDA